LPFERAVKSLAFSPKVASFVGDDFGQRGAIFAAQKKERRLAQGGAAFRKY
jgi:hypothetical protein